MNREDLIENVEGDPNRASHEKETGFHFSADTEKVSITSFQSTVVKYLLRNEQFEIDMITAKDGVHDILQGSLEFISKHVGDDYSVIGVQGTLPIGSIKIRDYARSSNHVSRMFSLTENE